MNGAVLRPAAEEDFDFIRTLDCHISDCELRRKIAAGRVLCVMDGERRCGVLRWGLFWDNTPFLNLIHLAEPFRRRGLGSRALAEWEDACRRAGYQLVLTSTLSNEEAQHFYRRLGYCDCGCLLLPGEPNELLLRKELGVAVSQGKTGECDGKTDHRYRF